MSFLGLTASANIFGPLTTSTPVTSSLTDWSNSLLFPKFDPSLGTLVSVELTTSIGLDTQLTITNLAASPSSGTDKAEVQFTLTDPGLNINQQTDTIWPAGGFAYSLNPGDSVTSPVLTKTDSSDQTYTLAAILAEFTGSGNIALPIITFTQTLLANTGGNTSSGQVTNASATGTVTYVYTPTESTPEPATMALLGSALIGIGMIGRKRLAR